ncbi:hypothetical protein [Mycolicibacterium monacense]|uniref:Uncharacterized protein n=2 Tax=unclassified Mycobacterium TaxID=2642494 RepID=A0A5Q5BM22_MYCSS|nr:hypothetical protein [Mycolicibacterium monacense]OBB66417.1 hypothetical protein A6B34_21605 [Mycolicibacterium monacense]OBF52428.1 hypothetical protein A5778_14955 [Mycolicibacterium monacense]
MQYSPQWVQYDNYYRPRICNPYRNPLRVVYYYEGAPRVSIIPPLGNIVVEAAAVGAYNFTAMVLDAVGAATNVAVGSFFGGGYFPGLDSPAQAPLPGDYALELVSDEASGLSLRDKFLIGLAGTLGALALAAVGLNVHLSRRRPRV